MSKEKKEKDLKETAAEEQVIDETVAEEVAVEEERQENETADDETAAKAPKEEEKGSAKKIADLEAAIAKEKDSYIRLMAEFDNFRRRTAQEKLDLVSMASTDTIKGLLPVLDDCERALSVLQESDDSAAAKEGTELIYNKLTGYLKSKGLAVIEALGQPFDTDLHEAVAQFPVDDKEKKGKVFDVVQTGYTLNGKVIRFAKVVVGI